MTEDQIRYLIAHHQAQRVRWTTASYASTLTQTSRESALSQAETHHTAAKHFLSLLPKGPA